MLPLVLALLAVFAPADAHELTLKKPCGEITCESYTYCHQQELICRPCDSICDVKSSNAQADQCEQHCQDYIHDKIKRYVRQEDLSDIINTIFWLVLVTLILVVILAAVAGGVLGRKVYRSLQRRQMRKIEDKKFKEKLSSVQYSINNNEPLRDKSITFITQPIHSTLPSTTLTPQTDSPNNTNRSNDTRTSPLSTEDPVEDTTLDYATYVNQALSHSPSNENTLNNPKF